MINPAFAKQWEHYRARANQQMQQVLSRLPTGDAEKLANAIRYSTLNGGKRFRAMLVYASGECFGATPQSLDAPAVALELIHAYSLVHDDLPAMDDDDLRRGRPSCHIEFDEATAILAGDALQSLAFDLLSRPQCSSDPSIRIALIVGLAKAGGAQGMVLGQAQDIAAETAVAPLNLEQISTLQRNKTGALIEWSACAGAILAGEDTTPMQQYAQALGLAFQIVDDILDVEGSAGAVGKAVRKDKEAGKATFVSLLGLADAKAWAQSLVNEACDALAPFGRRAESLKAAAQFVVSRNN